MAWGRWVLCTACAQGLVGCLTSKQSDAATAQRSDRLVGGKPLGKMQSRSRGARGRGAAACSWRLPSWLVLIMFEEVLEGCAGADTVRCASGGECEEGRTCRPRQIQAGCGAGRPHDAWTRCQLRSRSWQGQRPASTTPRTEQQLPPGARCGGHAAGPCWPWLPFTHHSSQQYPSNSSAAGLVGCGAPNRHSVAAQLS